MSYTPDQADAKLAKLAGTLPEDKYEHVMKTGQFPKRPKAITSMEELAEHMERHAQAGKQPAPSTAAAPRPAPPHAASRLGYAVVLAAVSASYFMGLTELAMGAALGTLIMAVATPPASRSSLRPRLPRRGSKHRKPRSESIPPPPVSSLNF